MISVKIQNNIVALKDIEHSQLENIIHWYNMSEDYRYATGTDSPVSMEMLEAKYFAALKSEYEIFLGILSIYENRIIGIISGKISEKILWINVIAIGLEFQRKRYGSISVELLLKHFKENNRISEAYLAVADKNLSGHSFWRVNGFIDVKNVNNKVLFDGKKHNVIIMKKRI